MQDRTGLFEVSLPLSSPSNFLCLSHPLFLFPLSSLWSEEVIRTTAEGSRKGINFFLYLLNSNPSLVLSIPL